MSWIKRRRDEEDERDGVVIELDPIDIVGDPGAPEIPLEDVPLEEDFDDGRGGRVINELAPIEIQGRVPQRTEPSYDLPDFVVDAVGQPVTDTGSGLGGWEAPEWLGRAIADDEGNAPEGVLEAARNLAPDAGYLGSALLSPASLLGGLTYDAAADRPTPSREDRTLYAAPAIAGAADALSFGLADDAADLVYGDNSGSSMDWAEEQYPGSFNAGAGAALLGQAAIPGATMDDAPAYARAAATALDSGVQGALSGFGHSDAETIGGRLNDAAGGALLGGAIGGGVGALTGRVASRAAEPVDEARIARLRQEADLDRLSQMANGRINPSELAEVTRSSDRREQVRAARWLVDQLENMNVPDGPSAGAQGSGAFASGSRFFPAAGDDIRQRMVDAGQRGAGRISEIEQELGDTVVGNAAILDLLDNRIAELQDVAGAEPTVRQLRRRRGDFERLGESATMEQLRSNKNFWRDQQRFPDGFDHERRIVFRGITDAMQQGVERANPALGPDYRQARVMSDIGDRAERLDAALAVREGRNRINSLSDNISFWNMLAERGPVQAVASVVGNKFARRNEHALRAAANSRVIEQLQTRPERFGRWAGRLQAAQQRGPRFFAAALYAAQQDDPQVRQAVMADEEAEQQQPALESPQEAPMLPEDAPIEDFLAPIPPDDAPIEDFL